MLNFPYNNDRGIYVYRYLLARVFMGGDLNAG